MAVCQQYVDGRSPVWHTCQGVVLMRWGHFAPGCWVLVRHCGALQYNSNTHMYSTAEHGNAWVVVACISAAENHDAAGIGDGRMGLYQLCTTEEPRAASVGGAQLGALFKLHPCGSTVCLAEQWSTVESQARAGVIQNHNAVCILS
jgi:hypothetical protein